MSCTANEQVLCQFEIQTLNPACSYILLKVHINVSCDGIFRKFFKSRIIAHFQYDKRSLRILYKHNKFHLETTSNEKRDNQKSCLLTFAPNNLSLYLKKCVLKSGTSRKAMIRFKFHFCSVSALICFLCL